jgi:hypothetical protein
VTADIVKFAFIAGEISPTLFGRTDLTKFDLGMAEARNFFVDYRGGLSSVPGTKFMEHVYKDQLVTRKVPFSFAPEDEDTYIILFGDDYIRFLQGGYYVLEDSNPVTGVTQAPTGVLTSIAHGLAAGRWVKISGVVGMTQLNGKTFEVRSPAANTFQLYSVPDGLPVDTSGMTAYASGGIIEPVYEITSPYGAEHLEGLSFDQYRDRLRITSRDFAVRDLVRADHASWSIDVADISPYAEGPEITNSSVSAAGNAETIFSVTKVLSDGTESALGNLVKISNMVNYPVAEGSVSILWAAETDAEYYNVYRSIVSVGEDLSFGSELGYVGRTRGTKFTDPNTIPDFGRVPPTIYDPFEPGAITSITITADGSGYTYASTVSATGAGATGTGFVGQVIVNDSGNIVNVIVKNGGSGYVEPVTISFAGAGAGATATAEARPLTGTYPALSAIFQQRQVFAASESEPITVWGSQYKRFKNFNYSDLVLDSDSYEMGLDTAAIAPIKHLFTTRGGLLAMTQEAIWLLNGGSSDKALTPSNALADPQTYTGVSGLVPLRVGSGLLYTEGKGYAVRMLEYNEVARVYSGTDRSILANHLFGSGKEIIRWGYQESPFKTVWCVRADGVMLAFTIVSEEEVFAWTPRDTRGKFTDLVVVREGNSDVVYLTVERFINGRWSKHIERMDLRQFRNVEDAWCVDCGLSLEGTAQSGSVTIYRDDDVYTAVRTAGSFIGTAGRVLRAANGIFRVDIVTSSTEVVLTLWAEPDNWVPQTERAFTYPESDWTLDAPVTTLSGLGHLEGEEVAILGDGNVMPRQTVVNAAVTLSNGVTRAIVGLPLKCRAKTLPLIVPDAGIEGKRKRIVAVSPRLINSRGLKMGESYDNLYAMKERTTEMWGRPTALQDGVHHQSIGTTWGEEAFTYFELDDPLPVTLLSLVQDTEVGDEPD